MSFEEAELLRKRAHSFLRNVERLVDEGEYDLAVFSLEQYCQLILKYKLLVAKGSYPRTYMLRRLIRELGEIYKDVLVLVNDVRNLHYIARVRLFICLYMGGHRLILFPRSVWLHPSLQERSEATQAPPHTPASSTTTSGSHPS